MLFGNTEGIRVGRLGHGVAIGTGGVGLLLACVMTAAWLGGVWRPSFGAPRDYEDCEAAVPQDAPKAERNEALRQCDVRFPARRKPGGGYVYYDMLQDRQFDIAGPAPTPEEQKRIDAAYVEYLGAQHRREAAAEASRAQSDRLRQRLEEQRAAEQPLTLGPPPPPLPRPRPKKANAPPRQDEPVCTEGPLLCAWGKLQGGVKTLLDPSGKPQARP